MCIEIDFSPPAADREGNQKVKLTKITKDEMVQKNPDETEVKFKRAK